MKRAYGVAMEFGHDSLHSLLVLFQQLTELPVLLVKSMVFYDYLSVCPLKLRVQSFCGTRTSMSWLGGLTNIAQTFGDIDIESIEIIRRRFVTLCLCMCLLLQGLSPGSSEKGTTLP